MSLTAPCQSLAQLDSLRSVAKARYGIERFDVLYEMVRATADWNIDSSISIAYQAHAVALRYSDSIKIMTSHRVLGQLLNRISKGEEAEKYLLAALPLAVRFGDDIAVIRILNNLGISYLNQGEFGNSLKYLLDALELSRKNDVLESYPNINVNIGNLYYKIGEPQKALRFYEEALRVFSDSSEIANTLTNAALAENTIGDIRMVEKYLSDASAICARGMCKKRVELNLQFALGYCKYFQDQFDDAEEELKEALLLAESWGDERFKAECLLNLAKIDVKRKDVTIASRRIRMSEEICVKHGINEVLDDLYYVAADINIAKGNFESASHYLKLLTVLNDSMHNKAVRDKMLALEVEHAQKESNEKILAQEKLLVMKEEVIQSQRMGFIAFSIAGALLVLLLVVFWKHSKEKSRMNKLLEERVEERTRALHERLRAIEESESFEALTSLSALKNMRKSIASLQGLFQVALNEINDPSVSKEVQARLLIISNDIQENLTLMQKRENTL